MTLENKTLVLDLIEWLGDVPRPYRDVMEAWRTSCPRLPIWEDAVDEGLVSVEIESRAQVVSVTAAGRELLAVERPAAGRA